MSVERRLERVSSRRWWETSAESLRRDAPAEAESGVVGGGKDGDEGKNDRRRQRKRKPGRGGKFVRDGRARMRADWRQGACAEGRVAVRELKTAATTDQEEGEGR